MRISLQERETFILAQELGTQVQWSTTITPKMLSELVQAARDAVDEEARLARLQGHELNPGIEALEEAVQGFDGVRA